MQIRKKTVDVWMGFEVAKRKEECNYTIFTKNKKKQKENNFLSKLNFNYYSGSTH